MLNLDPFKCYKVVKVLDESKVIINAGSNKGINLNDRFELVEVGEELFDPDSDESLGNYEISKGFCCVVQVMDKMSIVRAEYNKKPRNSFLEIQSFLNGSEERSFIEPPQRNDEARGPIYKDKGNAVFTDEYDDL